MLPLHCSASWLASVPTKIATIREVGHAPYREAPEAFNGLVLDFLRRHRWQP